MDFLIFSLVQGILAFLAPCAVALLPGYLSGLIARDTTAQDQAGRLRSALKLAVFILLGVITVYLVAGGLILVAAGFLKQYMKWIALGLGVGIIVLGVLMLLGKNVSLSFHLIKGKPAGELAEAYGFGMIYSLEALGCLFPLFLVVTTQALSAPSLLWGVSYLAAYVGGISIMMITVIVLTVLSREFLQKNLRRLMPHISRISGVLMIIAGLYIVWYQYSLF